MRIYVTTGSSRAAIARALSEYRQKGQADEDVERMLSSTVRQIRAELRERRRVNRACGFELRSGWMSDAEYSTMMDRYADLGYLDKTPVAA